MSNGNRCDACGRFCAWGDLSEDEYTTMDLGGHLTQTWLLECSECRGVAKAEEVSGE